MTSNFRRALADLRHLYAQMTTGGIRDQAGAARGLLGPAIATLERLEAGLLKETP